MAADIQYFILIFSVIFSFYIVLGIVLKLNKIARNSSLKIAIFVSSMPFLLFIFEIDLLLYAIIDYTPSAEDMGFGIVFPYLIIFTILAFVITFAMGYIIGMIIDRYKSRS